LYRHDADCRLDSWQWVVRIVYNPCGFAGHARHCCVDRSAGRCGRRRSCHSGFNRKSNTTQQKDGRVSRARPSSFCKYSILTRPRSWRFSLHGKPTLKSPRQPCDLPATGQPLAPRRASA
jgi:hypothetical protein